MTTPPHALALDSLTKMGRRHSEYCVDPPIRDHGALVLLRLFFGEICKDRRPRLKTEILIFEQSNHDLREPDFRHLGHLR